MPRSLLAAAVLALILFPPLLATADTLITVDGRVVEGFPMERTADGARVRFAKGTVTVPRALIGILVLEGDEDEERQRAANEAVLRRSWENRHRMKTAHFVFEFTLPDGILRPVAKRLEAYSTALFKEWGVELPASKRLHVKVVHSETQAEQVLGLPSGSPGRLVAGDDPEIQILLDHRDLASGEKVLRNLVARRMLQLLGPELDFPLFPLVPLSDYYAASRETTTGAFELGTADGGHLESLRAAESYDTTPTVTSLIMTPLTREARPFAWSLVRFLLQSEVYAPRFRKYVTSLAQSDEVKRIEIPGEDRSRIHPDENRRSFLAALGFENDEELAALAKGWQATMPGKLDDTDAQQHLQAARAAARLRDPQRAMEHFEQAVRLGCDGSFVHFEIGTALLAQGNRSAAMVFWQKARTLDPLDPAVTGAIGRLLMRGRARNEGLRLMDLALELSRVIR